MATGDGTCHHPAVAPSMPSTVSCLPAERFQRLAATWQAETKYLSSLKEIVLNRAYQQIIGMGDQAVPLILRELEREPDHWFWALTAITGYEPDLPEESANVETMAAAWLEWGRGRGLATSREAS